MKLREGFLITSNSLQGTWKLMNSKNFYVLQQAVQLKLKVNRCWTGLIKESAQSSGV